MLPEKNPTLNWFDNAKFHQTDSFTGQVPTRERASFRWEGTGFRNPLQSYTICTGHKTETQKKKKKNETKPHQPKQSRHI